MVNRNVSLPQKDIDNKESVRPIPFTKSKVVATRIKVNASMPHTRYICETLKRTGALSQ